jgi:hypothetical protein
MGREKGGKKSRPLRFYLPILNPAVADVNVTWQLWKHLMFFAELLVFCFIQWIGSVFSRGRKLDRIK